MISTKDYRFVKCEDPRYITNPYTRQKMVVPCGHCKACTVNRAAAQSMRLSAESRLYKYTLFLTLTYNEENVPIFEISKGHAYDASLPEDEQVSFVALGLRPDMRFVRFTPACSRLMDVEPVEYYGTLDESSDYMKVCRSLDDYYSQQTKYYDKLEKRRVKVNRLDDGYFRVAYYPDVQKFFKLLRIKLIRDFDCNEKIRYYIVSEYGPKSFRPHFHVLLFFNSDSIFEALEKPSNKRFFSRRGKRNCYENLLLSDYWKLGVVTSERATGSAANYVASYINSSACLPSVLKLSEFRPICRHSIKIGEIFREEMYKDIPTLGFDSFIRQTYYNGKKYVDISVWRSFENRFFPRCPNGSTLSDLSRFDILTAYQRLIRYTPEAFENLSKFTDLFTKFVRLYGQSDYYVALSSWCDSDAQFTMLDEVVGLFFEYCSLSHSLIHLRDFIYRAFLAGKLFWYRRCQMNMSNIDYYNYVKKYYAYKATNNLIDDYQWMEVYPNTVPIHYACLDGKLGILEASTDYRRFVEISHFNFAESIKHKDDADNYSFINL